MEDRFFAASRMMLLGWVLLVAVAASGVERADPVRSVADAERVAAPLTAVAAAQVPFELEGQVLSSTPSFGHVSVDGRMEMFYVNVLGRSLPLGAVIRARGTLHKSVSDDLAFNVSSFEKVGDRPLPPARPVSVSQFAKMGSAYGRVAVVGTVEDILRDDIDSRWHILVLREGGERIYLTAPSVAGLLDQADRLLGARVRATGLRSLIPSQRRYIGPVLLVGAGSDIELLAPARGDPFAVPELDLSVSTNHVFSVSENRRIEGRVLAAWGGDRCLLETGDGAYVELFVAAGCGLPAVGCRVRAVGRPVTNFFRIDLERSQWEYVREADETASEEVLLLSAADLYAVRGLRQVFRPDLHGKRLLITGTVQGESSQAGEEGFFYLSCGGRILDVWCGAGSVAPPVPGSRVEVQGRCIVNTGYWSYGDPVPRITGYTLVAESGGLRVISRPSWWTVRRLLGALGVVVAILLAVLGWTVVLNRTVARRSRELLREQVAHAAAALKVGERTRLAAELHDTLSQNLTGVACQVAAAKSGVDQGRETVLARLETAERMLLSSRTELRRCLFDLRGTALEERFFDEALRKTLEPIAVGIDLAIRFRVPLARFSDTTAHALLCIVRELVTNAVRHGGAKRVRVAGECRGGALSFLVRDDGKGFDVSACPGPGDGHFGLAGIRERAERLGGVFTLESSPGAGATARFEMRVVSTVGEGEGRI